MRKSHVKIRQNIAVIDVVDTEGYYYGINCWIS